MLTAIHVCAGAGGLSLGLHRAGFEVRAFDLDRTAALVHEMHVGPCAVDNLATYHPSAPADVAIGGVPCQPYSMAGDRKGMRDVHGSLFEEAHGMLFEHLVRVAVEANARAVVLENVPGLVSWNKGAALAAVLESMRRGGYEPVWRILNAADYGVPQLRKRLFVVGVRPGLTFTWPEPTHGDGRLPSVTVREALGLTGDYVAARDEGARGWNGQRSIDVDAPAPVVLGSRNADKLNPLDVPAPVICAGRDATANAGVRQRLGDALSLLDRPAPTITTVHDETRDPHSRTRRPCAELAHALADAGILDRPATTVQADSRLATAGHHERQQRGAVRLTTEQRALLQGFPPGWQWPSHAGNASRLIGNAVPPALGEAVARAVATCLTRAPSPGRSPSGSEAQGPNGSNASTPSSTPHES